MQALSQLSYTPKRVCMVAEKSKKCKFFCKTAKLCCVSLNFPEKKAPSEADGVFL